MRSWRRGSGGATLYRRDVSDAFLRTVAIDDSNPNYDIVNRIYENAGNFRQTGVQVTGSHQFRPAGVCPPEQMKKAIMNHRAELVFTFTDIFNDFALQHDIRGRGFTAVYQNFLETQVATFGIRYRF